MTFCLGIKVDEELVGIADTRVLSGSEVILARKVPCIRRKDKRCFCSPRV